MQESPISFGEGRRTVLLYYRPSRPGTGFLQSAKKLRQRQAIVTFATFRGARDLTSARLEQAEIRRAFELSDRAAESWELIRTDFLTPPIVADVLANVKKLAGVTAKAWGGYERAERCRVCFGKEELMFAAQQDLAEDFIIFRQCHLRCLLVRSLHARMPTREARCEARVEGDVKCQRNSEGGVAALSVTGRFAFDAATHRDFLGACLGTGIERSKVGDILVLGENGCQIMVVPDLVEHLESTLVQVRSVPVETSRVPLSELSVPEPKVDRIRTVEASLRLDSVASAGFRLSRGKMTDIVKAGDVRVNWKPAKAAMALKSGDVISCAGKGRVEVGEVSTTKKGRFAVELVRYI